MAPDYLALDSLNKLEALYGSIIFGVSPEYGARDYVILRRLFINDRALRKLLPPEIVNARKLEWLAKWADEIGPDEFHEINADGKCYESWPACFKDIHEYLEARPGYQIKDNYASRLWRLERVLTKNRRFHPLLRFWLWPKKVWVLCVGLLIRLPSF